MAYEFFFSYSRNDNDRYLHDFFELLSNAVRDLIGAPRDKPVGFFDQRDLERGDDWDAVLVEALQTSKVFIAITSAAYLKSDYCGKEWALFDRRLRAHVPDGTLPPLLKPLLWISVDKVGLPAAMQKTQFKAGDPSAEENVKGYKYAMKRFLPEKLEDLAAELANQIVDAGAAHAVPRLADVPALRDVPSAFAPPALAAADIALPKTAPARAAAPDVRFVYVAADPAVFGLARSQDAYVTHGGPDWKPFFPSSPARIGVTAQGVASIDMDMTSDTLLLHAGLLDDIKEAGKRNQIVILIVDGWSLQWSADFRSILSLLDERLDYHWCVLIPRNDADAEVVQKRDAITAAIFSTFGKHARLTPHQMREGIVSEADFKCVLREMLTRLREQIRLYAPIEHPIPAGPAKAFIVGPTGGV